MYAFKRKKIYGITDGLEFVTKKKNYRLLLKKRLYALQYRNKVKKYHENVLVAKQLSRLCLRYKIPFIINDSLKLARRVKADGVHIGQTDMKISYLKRQLCLRFNGQHKQLIIGVSCHKDIKLAVQADLHQTDYVAFGVLYPSQTKPNKELVKAVTIKRATQILFIPVIAIGGIETHNLDKAIQTQADAVAMIEGLKKLL